MFQMEFPLKGQPVRADWWAPLEAVARVVAGEPHYRFFDLADFMLMGKLRRRKPRPDLLIYKHRFTRRYLHLDEAGHAYRYVAPRDLSRAHGRHLRHRDLGAALDALRLWELPWMKRGFEHQRQGLTWNERWLLREPEIALVGEGGTSDGRLHLV